MFRISIRQPIRTAAIVVCAIFSAAFASRGVDEPEKRNPPAKKVTLKVETPKERTTPSEPRATLPPKVPLEVTVKAAKEKVKAGEPIEIAVEIINTSKHALWVEEKLKVVEVYRDSKKEAPRTAYYQRYYHRFYEPPRVNPGPSGMKGCQGFDGKLNPGDSCAVVYLAGILYDMTNPGKYEVGVEVTFYDGDDDGPDVSFHDHYRWGRMPRRLGATESKPVIVHVGVEPYGNAPETVIRRAKNPVKAE